MKILVKLFLSAAVVIMLPVLGAAQHAVEDAHSRLQRDRGRLEAQQHRTKELQVDLAKVARERALLDNRMTETIKLLQQAEAHVGLTEARLVEHSKHEERLRKSIREKEGWLSDLLAAGQSTSKITLPSSIRSPEDATAMVRRIALAARARPELRDQAVALSEQINQLVPVMAAVRTETEQLRAAVVRHNEARSRLDDLLDFKWLSTNLSRRELSHVRRSAAEIGVSTLWLEALVPGVSPTRRAELQSQAFAKAQPAVTSPIGTALSQMAARFASNSGQHGGLVRQAQDLSAAWDRAAVRRIAALSLPQDLRDRALIAQLRSEMRSIERRLETINALVGKEFPILAMLSDTAALDLADAQALLKPDEALIFYYVASGQALVWAIKSEGVLWQTIRVAPPALAKKVKKLRHGLACPSVTADLEAECVASQLEFDVDLAHEIYQLLFGPIANAINDKQHLIIVASGALTSLPFHVFVTERAQPTTRRTPGDYRKVAWLGTRQAMTILPSITSLRALRQFAKRSRASNPYLGVGNPLLNGPQDDLKWAMHYTRQAAAARSRQVCPGRSTQPVAAVVTRSVISFNQLFRGSKADLDEVLRLTPLPETADELCEVGRQLDASESDILLGSRATEAAVKELSKNGRLADYRVLHFATHGVLAGQVRASVEPSLILTPPSATKETTAIGADDGLLTTSEIGELKMDADWVVLSACNTAGANDETAEPLSGMARAFFYAGARTLLVSHWEVNSDAAVFLVTRTFAELNRSPEIGRAEALRRAMHALMEDKSQPAAAHPATWAPFFVVGEGG